MHAGGTNWTGEDPPKGWTAKAYSPDGDGTPQFGDDYEGEVEAENYDAREDPFHPLKNPTKDPGEGWGGAKGSGLNNTFMGTGGGDWDWGERYYGAVFDAPIEVTNHCTTPQPVSFFTEKLPFLTLPPTVTVPSGTTTIMGSVQLPDEPPPPLHSGDGHIDFGPIIIPPGMMPPPKLHQPNFEEIEGTVIVWHPWAPADDCNAARETYTVTGHIHFNPPGPPDRGPERLAETDVCTVWWQTGERPAQAGDADCTAKFRELAAAFIERILPPYVLNAPEQWMWLPGTGELGSMSAEALLYMKARAEAVMGHRSSAPPPPAASAAASPLDRSTTGAVGR